MTVLAVEPQCTGETSTQSAQSVENDILKIMTVLCRSCWTNKVTGMDFDNSPL